MIKNEDIYTVACYGIEKNIWHLSKIAFIYIYRAHYTVMMFIPFERSILAKHLKSL